MDWLAEVPEGWTAMRLKFLIRDGYDGMKIGPFGSQLTSEMLDDEGLYKIYGQENIIAKDFQRGSRFISDDKFQELSVYEIRPGDLLVTMMGTSGKCDVVPADVTRGIMDSHLLRLRVRSAVRGDFVRLLIDEAAYVGTQIQLTGKGSIMHGLNSSIVKGLLLLVPPVEEQAQILTFLARETAKIDALVAEQLRLIDLLKENRQAVISHAVTKGLNPHAPMKQSGIESLGEVPGYWEVTRVKYATKMTADCPHETPNYSDEGDYLVIRTADVEVGRLLDDEMYRVNEAEYQRRIRRSSLEAGDVVYTREGERWGLAACIPVSGRYCLGQRMFQLRAASHFSSEFLMWHLSASCVYRQAEVDTVGATAPHVNLSTIRNFLLVNPPQSEQQAISAFLGIETAKLDALAAEAENAIDLLQERRTALISAAVTGKIDVRALVETEAA